MSCPLYLKDYEQTWLTNPRQAKIDWFAHAGRGLFLHYGLYSLQHEHEWYQTRNRIPVDTYAKLADYFTAHNFDADRITDYALANGLKYITLTACHHESFCLWDSQIESFNSMRSPARRDLVRELSEACDRKGLGFFAYYTFMLNWRHPYYCTRQEYRHARPNYPTPDPHYLYKGKEDFPIYIDYIQKVIDELLSNYKLTGIWFDAISAWWDLGPSYIPVSDIYANIRSRHPDTIFSWKSGADGTEDFASPEHDYGDPTEKVRKSFGDEAAASAHRAFLGNNRKHNEICTSVQLGTWGFCPQFPCRSAQDIATLLQNAQDHNCNLLINIGPMADGSLSPILTSRLTESLRLFDSGNFNLSTPDTQSSSAV